jgi:16S rRNA (adenine1518-N6/adenine1519-N6)-dimethyltransferase
MARRPQLGQHFLDSPRYRERIAKALRLGREDLVIEIGAGRGAMSGLLAARARKVLAIELDAFLAGELERKFHGDPRLQVHRADILATNLAELCRSAGAGECYVFGNLPYYITSPILHHLFTFRGSIRGMTLLVQHEVAERITASPGVRDYGYLSVLCQLFSQPRLLFNVPPGAFSPPPKVQSALVDFQMMAQFSQWSRKEEEAFLEFAKHSFAHKRKSLLNNLLEVFSRPRVEDCLKGSGLTANLRAEQLSVKQLASLFALLKDNLSSSNA